MATATQARTPPPASSPPTHRESITAPLNDMEEDLVRFNSVLDWLETHGDDDAFSVVSLMRPFATSLGNRLDGLRSATTLEVCPHA